jgi:predicted small metal-binding protein
LLNSKAPPLEAAVPCISQWEAIMRLFECGTLVPGCEWHSRADEDAELVRRAVEHLRQAHGETVIRENMVENIKSRIRDENVVQA